LSTDSRPHEIGAQRIELFSDAIFAIVITLLAIDLKLPITVSTSLIGTLVQAWPSFFAFIASFVTVLIMWMNHHYVFGYIKKADPGLMLLNGMLLLFVTLTPFTTSIVAQTMLLGPEAKIGAMMYSSGFLLLSFCWNMMWLYASKGKRLIIDGTSDSLISSISYRCYFGLGLYFIAIIVSFFSSLGGIMFVIAISAFWAAAAGLTTNKEIEKYVTKPRSSTLAQLS
jgi:uncharacterized membrane protein